MLLAKVRKGAVISSPLASISGSVVLHFQLKHSIAILGCMNSNQTPSYTITTTVHLINILSLSGINDCLGGKMIINMLKQGN